METRKHRVVLTGASGVLGRSFLNRIEGDRNVQVLALLRDISREPRECDGIEFMRVDFEDPLALSRIIERFEPSCLVHCAATGMNFPKTRWFNLIRFNVDVSINLCQCVAALPGCHFIHISTGLSYREQGRGLREDDPLDTQHPYGASKAAADVLVRSAATEFGVPMTVLRPFSFTGRWDESARLFPSVLRAAAEGRTLEMSPGDQVRDHCSARDIAEGIYAAMQSAPAEKSRARIFNLGSGDATPLRHLVRRVLDEIGLDVHLRFGSRGYSPYEPSHLVADVSRARQDLNWGARHNLAHAVWELARDSFPSVQVKEPSKEIRQSA